MANTFMVEWLDMSLDDNDKPKNKIVRSQLQIGNFDGNVEEAQNELDKLWPVAYPRRKNVKVLSVYGSGQIEKINIPRTT